jgi:hypothetical protein
MHHILTAGSKDSRRADQKNLRRTIMKALVSVLLALSVLTGIAASASAFDAKTFYEQQDREHGN